MSLLRLGVLCHMVPGNVEGFTTSNGETLVRHCLALAFPPKKRPPARNLLWPHPKTLEREGPATRPESKRLKIPIIQTHPCGMKM